MHLTSLSKVGGLERLFKLVAVRIAVFFFLFFFVVDVIGFTSSFFNNPLKAHCPCIDAIALTTNWLI